MGIVIIRKRARWHLLTVTVLLGIGLTWIAFQYILAPSVLPFFLFGLYSYWVPQIYRSATRGSSSGMDAWFILGTAAARLVLPLCTFPCPPAR